MNIWMLVYNNCTTDQRVLKEATTLSEDGHRLTVVAVLDKATVSSEQREGIRILRVDRRPLHYRLLWALRRIRRLIRYPISGVLERLGLDQRLAALRAEPAPGQSTPAAGAPAPPASASPRLARLIRGAGAPYRAAGRFGHRNLMRLHKPLMYSDWYWRAYRLARREPIDAVHAHDLNTLAAGAAIARHAGARLVYDSHELYPDVSTLSELESRVWRTLEPPLIRRADRVITVCESIGEELVRRYGIAPPQILLNCPPASEEGRGDPLALRQMAGIESEPIVLYQGGFVPNRGLEALVRAAALLHRGVIVLMGWGRLESELAAIVRREGLQERVRILPPVTQAELARYTAGADLGVIPYEPVGLNNYFTTPNKLFEYIAAGLPVVASDLPELRKVLVGRRVGLTFAHVDPAAIAEAVNAVLGDQTLLAELRANALAIRDEYTWERQAMKLRAIYDGGEPAEPIHAVAYITETQ
jgi:glycosyltransferase involved in cell wall biosynthesis